MAKGRPGDGRLFYSTVQGVPAMCGVSLQSLWQFATGSPNSGKSLTPLASEVSSGGQGAIRARPTVVIFSKL